MLKGRRGMATALSSLERISCRSTKEPPSRMRGWRSAKVAACCTSQFSFQPNSAQVCSSSTSYSFPWYSLCLSRIFYACAAAGGIFLPSFLPPPRLLSPPFLLKPHCFSWLNTHSEYRQRGRKRVERGKRERKGCREGGRDCFLPPLSKIRISSTLLPTPNSYSPSLPCLSAQSP